MSADGDAKEIKVPDYFTLGDHVRAYKNLRKCIVKDENGLKDNDSPAQNACKCKERAGDLKVIRKAHEKVNKGSNDKPSKKTLGKFSQYKTKDALGHFLLDSCNAKEKAGATSDVIKSMLTLCKKNSKSSKRNQSISPEELEN